MKKKKKSSYHPGGGGKEKSCLYLLLRKIIAKIIWVIIITFPLCVSLLKINLTYNSDKCLCFILKHVFYLAMQNTQRKHELDLIIL